METANEDDPLEQGLKLLAESIKGLFSPAPTRMIH